MSPSAIEDPPCRETEACYKSIEAESFPVGLVGKFGEGVPVQESSSSLGYASKLRDPSSIALELLYTAA
ncbi:hypothetical protein TNCV_3957551 [Trichonephila clavipes]|nr:hypothetical protein TNCV_3957551 [Trichonephila clavipes]